MIFKQKAAKRIGEEGCYFLCLVYIAEQALGREIDVVGLYDEACRKGWMEEDCYMKDPAAMLSSLLGTPCKVRKTTDLEERLAPGERDVRVFRRDATGVTYWHFVVFGESGRIEHDPLETSETVRSGRAVSRRIITIA